MYIRPKVVLTCSSKNVMSRTTAAIDIPPIFTFSKAHLFSHQPSRWVKLSLDRNDRMDIFQIFDGSTNFWNFFRDVEFPFVCYFDGGEIVVQGLPFSLATPKSSYSMSQEISREILPVNLQKWNGSVVPLDPSGLRTDWKAWTWDSMQGQNFRKPLG